MTKKKQQQKQQQQQKKKKKKKKIPHIWNQRHTRKKCNKRTTLERPEEKLMCMCTQWRLRSACAAQAYYSFRSPLEDYIGSLATYRVLCEDSDQTAWMRRLSCWVHMQSCRKFCVLAQMSDRGCKTTKPQTGRLIKPNCSRSPPTPVPSPSLLRRSVSTEPRNALHTG